MGIGIAIAIVIGIGIAIWIIYELYEAPSVDENENLIDIKEDDIDDDLFKRYEDEVE